MFNSKLFIILQKHYLCFSIEYRVALVWCKMRELIRLDQEKLYRLINIKIKNREN